MTVYREFILANYPVIKQHNQDLPVMIREAEGTPARVFARFGAYSAVPISPCCVNLTIERGVERHAELDNLNSGEVASRVAELLGLPKK
jgi:NADH dehydrogenase (ubiquinone) 1 alpha subcomplex subunit 2